MGIVSHNVPFGHLDFGKAFDCPQCGGGSEKQARIRRSLEGLFGHCWLDGTTKLHQHGMADFRELPEDLAVGKGQAVTVSDIWARGDLVSYDQVGLPSPTVMEFRPSASVVLSGEPGRGKTCLAAAAFVERTRWQAGLAIEYNALMDSLISAVADGNVSSAVRAVATVPVLFLDDLGNTFIDVETQGRQRWLFEIVNHRYNHELPTIITTNLDFWRLADQFSQKLAERLMERAVWCSVGGSSLRVNYGG